jgi:hypothetical protein
MPQKTPMRILVLKADPGFTVQHDAGICRRFVTPDDVCVRLQLLEFGGDAAHARQDDVSCRFDSIVRWLQSASLVEQLPTSHVFTHTKDAVSR